MAKYNLMAYILWLFLGLVGGHHFYLGRDRQGLLWLTSFGGMFGIGWLRDFTRIPAYVREANEDPEFILKISFLMRHRKRPSIWKNFVRVPAAVCFGMFYRMLVFWALPEEYAANSFIVFLLVPLGTTFGTYMVGSVGVIKSRWKYALVGAYLGELAFGYDHHILLDHSSSTLAVGISVLFSAFSWQYNRDPRARHLVQQSVSGGSGVVGRCRRLWCSRGACCRRFGVWSLVSVVYLSLLLSSFYFNATIVTEEGDTIKVREALNNFLKSPYWKQLKRAFWANMHDVWTQYWEGGWGAACERLMVLADFQGEERSRFVLGVSANATLSEVKTSYRRLAKEWHPDHHVSDEPEEKAAAQERFMEIKEAYETLHKLYKRRESRGRG